MIGERGVGGSLRKSDCGFQRNKESHASSHHHSPRHSPQCHSFEEVVSVRDGIFPCRIWTLLNILVSFHSEINRPLLGMDDVGIWNPFPTP